MNLDLTEENPEAIEMKKLRWRCRRGLLELDLMLHSCLDHRYPLMSLEEKRVFGEILVWEDMEILDALSQEGGEEEWDTPLGRVLAMLRAPLPREEAQ